MMPVEREVMDAVKHLRERLAQQAVLIRRASVLSVGAIDQANAIRADLDAVWQEAERLRFVVNKVLEWWDGLPPKLRQDIEGSGFDPGAIAPARSPAYSAKEKVPPHEWRSKPARSIGEALKPERRK